MPYATYKLMHLLGLFTMLTVLAATSLHVLRGGSRADMPARRWFAAAHGIAALMVLTGGFGLLARIGVMHGGLPGWAYAKLVIWVALGGALFLAYRGPGMAKTLLVTVPLLAVVGAAVALYKPF
jgi:hypothetical protein